jgi:hypothetical protein
MTQLKAVQLQGNDATDQEPFRFAEQIQLVVGGVALPPATSAKLANVQNRPRKVTLLLLQASKATHRHHQLSLSRGAGRQRGAHRIMRSSCLWQQLESVLVCFLPLETVRIN